MVVNLEFEIMLTALPPVPTAIHFRGAKLVKNTSSFENADSSLIATKPKQNRQVENQNVCSVVLHVQMCSK